MNKPHADWTRFSIADALVLTASVAVGFAIARHADSDVGRGVGGAVIGAALAGVAAIVFQIAVRGRRARLTAGEVLWLSPTALFVGVVAVSDVLGALGAGPEPLFVVQATFLGFGALAIFLSSVGVLVRTATGARPRDRCTWSDVAGCLASAWCVVGTCCMHLTAELF